jgi:long-chain acyl-CoA synthetase
LIDCSGDRDRIFTYGALATLVDALSRGLQNAFPARAPRVGIMAKNSAEFAALYLAAMRVGGVAVPLNPRLPGETIEHILGDAAVDILFTDEDAAPGSTNSILIGSDRWAAFQRPGSFEPVSNPDGLAQILYTSGSTGRPKGVPLTHAGQIWAVERAASFVEDGASYRVLVAAPMFHMNALFNLKRSLYIGASIVVLPSFKADAYRRAIDLYRCDWLTCVPAMMAILARHVGDESPRQFASVRRIFMSSSSFSEQLLETVQSMFSKAAILNSYGTTEAGPHVFEPHPDGLTTPPMSCGYPTASTMVRLVEEARQPIEGAGQGVLEMNTPATMAAYINLPDLSNELLREGWYHSRDVMRRDENGFYYFLGRSDDMFTCGGENIYPIEVEQVLEQHPHVEQAIVVPAADAVKQQVPVAFVVPSKDATPDETAMRQWFIERAPAYMHPRRIAFVAAMPLGSTSKIDRRELMRLAEALIAETKR